MLCVFGSMYQPRGRAVHYSPFVNESARSFVECSWPPYIIIKTRLMDRLPGRAAGDRADAAPGVRDREGEGAHLLGLPAVDARGGSGTRSRTGGAPSHE
jgi:hypothetical protein